MILHLLIVDDEEEVLESLVPGLVADLARRLAVDPAVKSANERAGLPLPATGRVNIKVSAHGYISQRVAAFKHAKPIHLHLHLCCDKGGSFRHALRLMKEQIFAVVVSDLRFSDDTAGARAGRLFIDDVQRRNPETFGVLYSAYQKPDGFPANRFVRKGAPGSVAGDELIDKFAEGVAHFLNVPAVCRMARELTKRGLVYQSESFGALLKRIYDFASMYFGAETAGEPGRQRPRPTLLFDGETGTGKTELAGLLHQASQRHADPFVSATCGQLADENLLRSTLFGHIKGSYSGATADRAGLVQAAGRGILLLDDLHKLSDVGSVILHSFLDDGEFSHVGQDEIRLHAESGIAVTVETPRWEEIISLRTLSDSFINRVEQLVVRVPTLRSRPEDIEHQALHYCQRQCQQINQEMELAPEAIGWLIEHGFPGGNSRKLRDFIKGLVSANARVTDYIGLAELEEFAAESNASSGKRAPSMPMPAAGAKPTVDAVPIAAPSYADWRNKLEPGGWQARVIELSIAALREELDVPAERAVELCHAIFERELPELWDRLQKLMLANGNDRPLEIKLVDELLRCFAIYRQGTPAKAAKELRMKDNALREFIYSREEKRKSVRGV